MIRKLYKFYREHYYAVNGGIIGLAIGASLVSLGIIKTLIIAICVLVGYYIGRRLQKDKDFIRNLLDRILPPGSYR